MKKGSAKDRSALEPVSANKQKFDCELLLQEGTRLAQRKAIVKKWLKEKEHSHYRYTVATCADGTEIFISRPTNRNKGFDFTIHIRGWTAPYRRSKNGKRPRRNTMPRHEDIFSDLKRKRKRDPKQFERLCKAIWEVYQCVEPSKAIGENEFQFKGCGLEVDVLLHVLKWLFIEQDLTYWNGVGRRMLMEGIAKICGVDFHAKSSTA